MKYRVQRATGAAAIAMTIAPGVAWQLEEIRVHLSAAGADELLTGTVDAGAGAAYDVVLISQNTNGITDYVFRPGRPLIFNADDELDLACANTDTRTYGIEVFYSAI